MVAELVDLDENLDLWVLNQPDGLNREEAEVEARVAGRGPVDVLVEGLAIEGLRLRGDLPAVRH